MYILELLKISGRALLANKLRSFLTTLGIVIGISAVIAMVSIGQGAQSVILDQVQGLGSNTITIYPVANFRGPTSQTSFAQLLAGRLDRRILDLFDDVNFREVVALSPEISGNREVVYRNRTENVTIVGVSPDYFSVRGVELAAGRVIDSRDNANLRDVAVLGSRIATKLFGESDPVGKDIKLGGSNYRVVGVAASKSAEFDQRILVPLSNAGTVLFGDRDFSQIVIQVVDESVIDSVAIKVEERLADFYRGEAGDNDLPFTVFTSKEFLELASTITGVFTTLLASIAGISLVVGGIGIMNIMLVSVTERTREIGLRKAVGAKQAAILGQFLLESVLLTLLGGLIGIALGIAFALLVSELGDIPALVTWQAILLATSVSVLIGILFGYYPAYRAARLNPIDALRYE